jgi:phage FluMu protein Com
MVHVYCLNEDCRRAIHLLSEKHRNFKGKVKCTRCGQIMEIVIKNGELVSTTKSKKE